MTPEFSRSFSLDRLRSGGAVEVLVEANPAERAALASRFGLPAIGALRCRFVLRSVPGGSVAAEGVLEARVTQVCVVSLDPFEAGLTEQFAIRFVPEGTESEDEDPDSMDEIPFTDSTLDLGEAAAEQLALALEPYPRKPGAELPEYGEEASGPFAALAQFRRPGSA
jgi:uncharacterized metal-binding protein YceD (DUF177 family)